MKRFCHARSLRWKFGGVNLRSSAVKHFSTPHPGPLLVRRGEGELFCGTFSRHRPIASANTGLISVTPSAYLNCVAWFAVFLLFFSAAFLNQFLHDGFLTGILLEDAAKRRNVPSHLCFGNFLPIRHAASLRRKFISVNSAFGCLAWFAV
jgi:hypothetical protein